MPDCVSFRFQYVVDLVGRHGDKSSDYNTWYYKLKGSVPMDEHGLLRWIHFFNVIRGARAQSDYLYDIVLACVCSPFRHLVCLQNCN